MCLVVLFCVNPSFLEIDADFNRIYSSIGIHDLISIEFYVHIQLFNTQKHKHSNNHTHILVQCAIVNHINKNTQYKQQTRAFIHAATDWHTVYTYPYKRTDTHSMGPIHTYKFKKVFFCLVESVQVWIKLHFGRIAVWVQQPSLSVYTSLRSVVRNGEREREREISSFQWLLCSFWCVHTYVFICDMNDERMRMYFRIYLCVRWCSSMLCLRISICLCMSVFVLSWSVFFSLLFTSLFLCSCCFHFTSHIRKSYVFVSIHIRYFQCVRLIRFLVLVVQLN